MPQKQENKPRTRKARNTGDWNRHGGREGRTQETGTPGTENSAAGGLAMALAEHLGSESLGGRMRQLVKGTKKRDNYYL